VGKELEGKIAKKKVKLNGIAMIVECKPNVKNKLNEKNCMRSRKRERERILG